MQPVIYTWVLERVFGGGMSFHANQFGLGKGHWNLETSSAAQLNYYRLLTMEQAGGFNSDQTMITQLSHPTEETKFRAFDHGVCHISTLCNRGSLVIDAHEHDASLARCTGSYCTMCNDATAVQCIRSCASGTMIHC